MSCPASLTRLLLLLPAALVLAACAAEQQPALNEADVLAREQARLDANKQIFLDFFAFQGSLEERAERFLADEYIQHNPRFIRLDEITGHSNTAQAFVEAIMLNREIGAQLLDPNFPLRDPVVLIAEDDIVIGLYRAELTDPDDPSRTYFAFTFQGMRVQDGKFTEHWDAVMLEEGWMPAQTQ